MYNRGVQMHDTEVQMSVGKEDEDANEAIATCLFVAGHES